MGQRQFRRKEVVTRGSWEDDSSDACLCCAAEWLSHGGSGGDFSAGGIIKSSTGCRYIIPSYLRVLNPLGYIMETR